MAVTAILIKGGRMGHFRDWPLPIVGDVSVCGVIAGLRVPGARSGQGGRIPPHAGQGRNLWEQIVLMFSCVEHCVSHSSFFTLFPP